MEISIEDSALGPIVQVGNLQQVRSFTKTTAKTVLSIVEGQTIAIGGMIRDSKNQSATGVPFLSKIPVIGLIFGSKIRESSRRELVLFLTPHIITDQNQSKTVTDEFREKVKGLKQEIEKREKK
jgi:general secretion pathway protein D